MKSFRSPEIAQLAHELTMSPLRHRLRQLAGAAHVLDLIESDREYPYSFVCFHVTGYRPRRTEETLLDGKALQGDLVQLMDELTVACPIPVEAVTTRLYDVDDMARRFNVSTKTITRWRARGLAGCWYRFADGKARFAATDHALERFVARNLELVRRGAAFQVMSCAEKQRIVSRARELVSVEKCTLHAVTLRLAEETGRCVETIRYTLRKFDREQPDHALFDKIEQPQPVDQNKLIFEGYARGETVKTLAARFSRSEADVRRTITAVRAAELIEKPVAYIYNPEFDAPGAEKAILSDTPPAESDEQDSTNGAMPVRVPSQVPAYLADLYRIPLLTRDEEYTLFRRLNYIRHLAETLRQKLGADARAAKATLVAQVDDMLEKAGEIKNRIVQCNLRLVVSIAKRHARGNSAGDLFELVSDGNMALMRAVDKFDYARGFRFSTYASWAVTRHYARTIPDEITHGDRYQTGHEEFLSIASDRRETADTEVAGRDQAKAILAGGLKMLDQRERAILELHFGLAGGGDSQTLDQIGREFGISKERVRQIELRALSKLRTSLGERAAELLAG